MNRVFVVSLILSVYSLKSFSRVIYEQCSWKNKHYTEKLLKDSKSFQQILENKQEQSEAGFCGDCQTREIYIDSVEGVVGIQPIKDLLNAQSGDIPPICFYASMTKHKSPGRRNYFYCPSSKDENPTRVMSFACDNLQTESGCQLTQANNTKANRRMYPRKACINKDYVELTAHAFNQMTDCFDLSKEEKIKIFSMFNYESSFHVNARSSGNARCYRQLTYNRFKFINKFIYYRNKLNKGRQNWEPYSQIYKDVTTKCPDLEKKVVPPKLLSETKHTDGRLNRVNRRSNFTCGLTHDIHSCLFYSLYSTKLDAVRFDREYDGLVNDSDKEGENIPEKLKRDFQLPIQFDEVLVIKGKVRNKRTGKITQVEWVLHSTTNAHRIFDNKYDYNMSDLTIRKVKLFAQGDLKSYFTRTAHNGGGRQISTHFERFVTMMKRIVSDGKACKGRSSRSINCRHRKAMLAGRPLTIRDLNQQFKRYVRPRKVSNKKEVINFIDRINRDVDFLNNTGGPKNPQPLRAKIRQLLSKNKDTPASERDINAMVNDVKRQCSNVIYQKR